MALETSLSAPAPVRQIVLAISQWVGRLGAVWVEGQMTQVSRRPGVGTVFMTLRDSAADISVPVTCARTLFDSLNPPLVEGASVVLHAKPGYYGQVSQKDKPFDVFVAGWASDWPTLFAVIPPILQSNPANATAGVGFNYGFFSSSKVDDLIKQATASSDQKEQIKLLQQRLCLRDHICRVGA